MNSELRTKIADMIEGAHGRDAAFKIADRILELLPKDESEAKLPDGIDLVSGPDGRYHVRANGTYLLTKGMMWCKMLMPIHEYPGEFTTCHQARAAALKAPPVPNDPHYMIPKPYPPGTSAIKLSPAVTHADMRRLATLGEEQGWPVLPKLLREIFKEPA